MKQSAEESLLQAIGEPRPRQPQCRRCHRFQDLFKLVFVLDDCKTPRVEYGVSCHGCDSCQCELVQLELERTRAGIAVFRNEFINQFKLINEQCEKLITQRNIYLRQRAEYQVVIERQARCIRTLEARLDGAETLRVPQLKDLSHDQLSQEIIERKRASPTSNTISQFQGYELLLNQLLDNLKSANLSKEVEARARIALETVFKGSEVRDFEVLPYEVLQEAVQSISNHFDQWYNEKTTVLEDYRLGCEQAPARTLHSLFLCLGLVRLTDNLLKLSTNFKRFKNVSVEFKEELRRSQLNCLQSKRDRLNEEGLDSGLECFDEVALFCERTLREAGL